MSAGRRIYLRWLVDRRLSTVVWTVGLVAIIVMTAGFYISLPSVGLDSPDTSGTLSTLMSASGSIDHTSPLGYLWSGLYANIFPMAF